MTDPMRPPPSDWHDDTTGRFRYPEPPRRDSWFSGQARSVVASIFGGLALAGIIGAIVMFGETSGLHVEVDALKRRLDRLDLKLDRMEAKLDKALK